MLVLQDNAYYHLPTIKYFISNSPYQLSVQENSPFSKFIKNALLLLVFHFFSMILTTPGYKKAHSWPVIHCTKMLSTILHQMHI